MADATPFEVANDNSNSLWSHLDDPSTTTSTPTSTAAPAATDTSSSGIPTWLQNILPGAGSTNTLLPGLATAGQMYYDAGQYKDIGNQAAAASNPFGNDQRSQYAQMLSDSYTDPQKFLDNDPSYAFLQKEGMAGLASAGAANGSMAFDTNGNPAGSYGKGIQDYSQGLASQELNTLRSQFEQESGANFNDSPYAGQYISQGGQQQLSAQGAALQAMMTALYGPSGTPAPSGAPQYTTPTGSPNGTSGLSTSLLNAGAAGASGIPGGVAGMFAPTANGTDPMTAWYQANGLTDPNAVSTQTPSLVNNPFATDPDNPAPTYSYGDPSLDLSQPFSPF